MMRPGHMPPPAWGGRARRTRSTPSAAALVLACGLACGCALPVARTPPTVRDRPAHPPPPVATTDRPDETAPATASPGEVVHRVLPGQTAWRIAHVYGVPLAELAAANGLDDPTRLAAGDLLRIPGADRALHVPPFPDPLVPVPSVEDGALPPGPVSEGLLAPVASARIVSGFGAPRGGRRHAGVDFDGRHGDRIVAALDGTVAYAGSGMRGYGRTVILDHGDGWTTLYAHASALTVAVGDRVRRGETIARVGRSGNASGAHCHFELRRDGRPVDPSRFLGRFVASRTP